ncbi:response regulator [Candidatus Halobeggiatoa sp. HSG11]|nr:response regulator [Candidatus Halobeggiatoa sp. HSG11]
MQATILVIDDEIISRRTIEALLESEYTLVFAENGKQGLERAYAIIPDLVLLDVMMKGMNGFEVCRLLRADFNDLPIVMVTGWDDPIAKTRCLELGASDIVSKPFKRDDLCKVINKLL